jgi:formylglycine-generating enzyme required for sulfatase activity
MTLTSLAWAEDNPSIHFIAIRPGTFLMGGEDASGNSVPPSLVHIETGFEMQSTLVTQLQWWNMMHSNPSTFSGPGYCPNSYIEREGVGICADFPVELVSWYDAQEFLKRWTAQDPKYNYRLPTEAEWEYAARAGTTTIYSFGDDVKQLGLYGWYDENSNNQTHAVASKRPNPWGLYDMHGNVWEWVEDQSSRRDPIGMGWRSGRVVRGGNYFLHAQFLRSDWRRVASPRKSYGNVGFRPVRTLK